MLELKKVLHGKPEAGKPIRVGNLCFTVDETDIGDEEGVLFIRATDSQQVIEITGPGQLQTNGGDELKMGDQKISYQNVFFTSEGSRVILCDHSADTAIRIDGNIGGSQGFTID